MGITAKEVASYFIKKSDAQGGGNEEYSGNNDLTNLKLQKILYFAQIEYMKKHSGKKLFEDEIQAWQFGPVIPAVYEWLKSCGPYIVTEFDVELADTNKLTKEITDFLDYIWEKYRKISAWGLVEKTHKPGSVWDKTYKKGLGNKHIISDELLLTAGV